MEPRYKVGDKVIVLPKDTRVQYRSASSGRYQMSYTLDMLRMAEQEYTVSKIEFYPYGVIYRLGGESWAWIEEFLKPAYQPSTNNEAKKLLSKEW